MKTCYFGESFLGKSFLDIFFVHFWKPKILYGKNTCWLHNWKLWSYDRKNNFQFVTINFLYFLKKVFRHFFYLLLYYSIFIFFFSPVSYLKPNFFKSSIERSSVSAYIFRPRSFCCYLINSFCYLSFSFYTRSFHTTLLVFFYLLFYYFCYIYWEFKKVFDTIYSSSVLYEMRH